MGNNAWEMERVRVFKILGCAETSLDASILIASDI